MNFPACLICGKDIDIESTTEVHWKAISTELGASGATLISKLHALTYPYPLEPICDQACEECFTLFTSLEQCENKVTKSIEVLVNKFNSGRGSSKQMAKTSPGKGGKRGRPAKLDKKAAKAEERARKREEKEKKKKGKKAKKNYYKLKKQKEKEELDDDVEETEEDGAAEEDEEEEAGDNTKVSPGSDRPSRRAARAAAGHAAEMCELLLEDNEVDYEDFDDEDFDDDDASDEEFIPEKIYTPKEEKKKSPKRKSANPKKIIPKKRKNYIEESDEEEGLAIEGGEGGEEASEETMTEEDGAVEAKVEALSVEDQDQSMEDEAAEGEQELEPEEPSEEILPEQQEEILPEVATEMMQEQQVMGVEEDKDLDPLYKPLLI